MRRVLAGIAALLLLDASVTFSNWWPTPGVWWDGSPSVELSVLLLVLALAATLGYLRPPASRIVRWLGIGWLVLVLGRYVDVTAPALWGRELNFYWDLRFLPDVAAMLLGASKRAILLGSVAAVVVIGVLFLMYLGYVTVRNIPAPRAARGTRSAVVGIVSALLIYPVHMSTTWWNSLHQGGTIGAPGESKIHGAQEFAFYLGFITFLLLAAWLTMHRFRVAWLADQVADTEFETALVDRRAEGDIPPVAEAAR